MHVGPAEVGRDASVVGGDIDSPSFVEILTERSADRWLAGRFRTQAVVRLI